MTSYNLGAAIKTILKGLLLATAISFAALPQSAFSENQPPSLAPELQYIGKLIEKATAERDNSTKAVADAKSKVETEKAKIETAKSELKNLQETPPEEAKKEEHKTKLNDAQKNVDDAQKKADDLQKKVDEAQTKIDDANLRIYTFTKARAALSDQEPIHALIVELKNSLDKIPANGNDSQKAERADIEAKIKALEKLDHSEAADSSDGVLYVLLGLVCIGVVVLLWKVNKDAGNSSKSAADDDSVARVRLAKAVTLNAMIFIVAVSMLTLGFAGINAMLAPEGTGSEKAMDKFFDIAKWVFATVLPVVAGWVGGVMAFYFGKENFRAGGELAKELKGAPQQKLEALKAGISGLEIAKAITFPLQNVKLEDVNLIILEAAFPTDGRDRLPIIDDKGLVQACLHKSTLKVYKDTLTDIQKNDPAKMNLGELMKTLKWDPKQSFGTVAPTDNLIRVQEIINTSKACQDVFVTSDGKSDKRAERWITNVDIEKIAI